MEKSEQKRLSANARQRERRRENGNKYTLKYEKTKKGFLVRLYRNMLSRVKGVNKNKSHLYLGLPIIPKEEFYDFSLSSCKFHKLFSEWEYSGYDRRLTPSIDRMDSSEGYLINNIRWVTFRENCANIKPLEEKRKIGKSGRRGVVVLRNGNFTASIGFKGKRHHLGTFNDLEDAIRAREEAELKYLGRVLEDHLIK